MIYQDITENRKLKSGIFCSVLFSAFNPRGLSVCLAFFPGFYASIFQMAKNISYRLLFIIFFTFTTMSVMPLLFLPLFILNIIAILGEPQQVFTEAIFLLTATAVPLIVLFIIYRLLAVLRNPGIFFAVSAIFMSFISYLNFPHELTGSNPANTSNLIGIGIVFLVFTGLINSYFFNKFFIRKNYSGSPAIFFSVGVVVGTLIAEWIFSLYAGESIFLNFYIDAGEFILKNFDVNIFYLDFYGTVGIFLSAIVSFLSLFFVMVMKLLKRK